MQDGNDLDKIFLIVTSLGGHLEFNSIGELDLDLFRFPLLMKIRRGTYRMGGLTGGVPF
jgi:hypothetical protein